MALEEYRRKRDFERTPEPRGEGRAEPSDAPRFVVQKHAATHLHYDVRLEAEGVLKSWSVPRGPSMDPQDRRLAVRTEDHPLDYADFEGVIPQGYGAGTVMVWDAGTYSVPGAEGTRESAEAVARGVEKGRVKVVLRGEKLKGEFNLVRMEDAGEEGSWLLLKGDDEFASRADFLQLGRSVKTGRTMEEVRAEGGDELAEGDAIDLATLELMGAKEGQMPTDVEPMLASLAEEPFDRPGWIYELKWDGFRAIAELHPNEVRLYSRHGIDYGDEFGTIVEELKGVGFEAVLDGEIVVVDESGRADFKLLQQYRKTGRGTLVYYVFDILYYEGYDLRPLPVTGRKSVLRKVLPDLPRVRYSDHIEGRGRALFRQAAEHGVEGVIAKDGASPYRTGERAKDWLKFKTRLQQEAVIGGFTAPRGSRDRFGALLLGVYEDDELVYVGHSGSGFDEATLTALRARLEPLVRPTSPFVERPPTNAEPTWVEPALVCEVRFAGWTEAGLMRQAIFLGLREDKHPHEVRRERLTSLARPPKRRYKRREAPGGRVVEIGGQEVALTHLDKVYFPGEGLTKGDVVEYYRDVAPTILPYLHDRPESLHRFPDGIDGESFYQKDVDYAPEWVRTVPVSSGLGEERVDYLVCQDAATLVYMANLGCIEINPWNSRLRHLDRPDYLALDLDPLGVDFEEVITVALAVHEILAEIEVPNLVKTSGARGLHVYVPLGAQYDYEQTRQFAFLIGHLVHRRLPDLTSLERSPKKRQEKVYLDLLQNRRGQTMTAPYSLRPHPGAPVSTPLRWDEVGPGLRPRDFTIHNIRQRVERMGDLWRETIGPGIDMEGVLVELREAWEG